MWKRAIRRLQAKRAIEAGGIRHLDPEATQKSAQHLGGGVMAHKYVDVVGGLSVNDKIDKIREQNLRSRAETEAIIQGKPTSNTDKMRALGSVVEKVDSWMAERRGNPDAKAREMRMSNGSAKLDKFANDYNLQGVMDMWRKDIQESQARQKDAEQKEGG